jgi:NAD(P)-dependent dehydrogenase (short-subunit alcohol dehydrogenase family)
MVAAAGYTAFAGVRNSADAQRLRSIGSNVRPVLLDVTDGASIEQAKVEVAASGVALRGVVSNAGIAVGGPLEHLPIDDLRRQFEVNVLGALALVQAFAVELPPVAGRVVFVGSISGRLAVPYVGAYSASKFALRAISDSLRLELAPAGIAVALVEPGSVKTPIWQKGRASQDRVMASLTSTHRPYYRDAMLRVLAQTEAEERDGMAVETVATAIVHALTSPKPRPRYLLGTPARMGGILALLPPRWRDRAVRASMRLP